MLKNLRQSKKNSNNFTDKLRAFFISRENISTESIFNFPENYIPHREVVTVAFPVIDRMTTRISADLFVKDELVKFNVAATDDAIENFAQGKIIPLRSVNDFTNFPPVENYSWNLYLLESFLRKYSKNFVLNFSYYNNSNIGAIYPASMNFADYLEVQVAAHNSRS